jgi:hypothetical protein
MAWITPKDWADNELVTAEKLNEQLRDNLKFLYAPAAARVHRTTSKSVADSTWTSIGFDAERFDTEDIHDNVTDNTRLTCKTAGRYLIFGHATFGSNATGVRKAHILLNGATTIAELTTPGGSISSAASVTTIYELAVDDYVELEVYQNSGGSLSLAIGGNFSPEFGMIRAG